MEDPQAYPAERVPRKIIIRPRLSIFFRFWFFIIAINVLLALVFCFYFVHHFRKQNEEFASIIEDSKDAELQIEIPTLIKPNEKIHYEYNVEEDYLRDASSDENGFLGEDNIFTGIDNENSIKKKHTHFESVFAYDKSKNLLGCFDKKHKSQILQRNDYWVFKNFYRAGHGQIDCYSSVTYAAHGDYTQLGNLPEILRRWNGPISLALYAPGSDFHLTLNALKFLLNCLPDSPILRMFLSVHIYFDANFIPDSVWKYQNYGQRFPKTDTCTKDPPYQNVSEENLYRVCGGLLYPINIARNIARDAALTHFVLDADLDLYPSLDLSSKFLAIIAEDDGSLLRSTGPRIFTLPVFGVSPDVFLPNFKYELRQQLQENVAHLLNDDECYKCNNFSDFSGWINQSQSNSPSIFSVTKRLTEHRHWEPYFIATNDEPFHPERFSREGLKDRTAQAYLLCTMNYKIYLLNSEFLLRKTSKTSEKNPVWSKNLIQQTENYLIRVLHPNMMKLFGRRKGCSIMEGSKL